MWTMAPITHYDELMAMPYPAPPHWAEPCTHQECSIKKNSDVSSDFPCILVDALVKRFAYTKASEITQGIQMRLNGLNQSLLLGFHEDAHHPSVAYVKMPCGVSAQAFVHKQQSIIHLYSQSNGFGLSRV